MFIYKIVCTPINLIYIGQTTNFSRRVNSHKSKLNRKIHENTKLQNAWNEYGYNHFHFDKIEEVNQNIHDAYTREDFWVDYYIKSKIYNVINGATPSTLKKLINPSKEMLTDVKNGISRRKYEQKYGYSGTVLKRLKKEFGIKFTKSNNVVWNKKVVTKEMIEDANNGISYRDFCNKYSCSSRILKNTKIELDILNNNCNKKINITNEMVKDAKSGISYHAWKDKYNCSEYILKKIRKENNIPKFTGKSKKIRSVKNE